MFEFMYSDVKTGDLAVPGKRLKEQSRGTISPTMGRTIHTVARAHSY